jgi:hypothetical protein
MTQRYTIISAEGFEATQHALGCIESVLASLRHDLLPHNPQLYAVMSEGYIDDIRELRAEIDEYLGLAPQPDPQSQESLKSA